MTLAPKKAYRKLREVNLKKLKKERYDWGKLCLCVLLSDLFVQIKVLLQCISHLCGSTFCNWNTALQWSTTANHGRSKYSVLAQWSTVQHTLLRNVSLVWFVWLEIGCRCFYVRTALLSSAAVFWLQRSLNSCGFAKAVIGGKTNKELTWLSLPGVLGVTWPGCHWPGCHHNWTTKLVNQFGQLNWQTLVKKMHAVLVENIQPK